MKPDRETELLLWLGGVGIRPESVTREDVMLLLAPLGLSRAAAEVVADGAMTAIYLSAEAGDSPNFRNAIHYGFTRLSEKVPELAQLQAVERGRALNLREVPVHRVDGHGTVHRGQSEHGLGGSRPHIYIWFEPLEEAPCSEYLWYQFAQPTLFIDGHEETDEVRRFSYETSGRATMKMGEWRTDFIQQGVDDVNSARDANGRPELPEFETPGLTQSPLTTVRPKGKPYIGPSIPGHQGSGVVDAPNLCYRGSNPTNRTRSNISRVYNEYVNNGTALSRDRPPAGSHSASIIINFRSYLVCIDDPVTCIGYLEWTYTTTATMRYEWRPTDSTHAGAGKRWWRRQISGRGDCSYSLEIGDFLPC